MQPRAVKPRGGLEVAGVSTPLSTSPVGRKQQQQGSRGGDGSGASSMAAVIDGEDEAYPIRMTHPAYYTVPSVEELRSMMPHDLAVVKDFVVGCRDVGWVKFYGETDVRGLDIDATV